MKNPEFIIIAAAVIVAIIIGVNVPQVQLQETEKCQFDSDCVPATCCHATSCVLKQNAPDCQGVLCTMDCKPGTLDCGGSCVCNNGVCEANIIR